MKCNYGPNEDSCQHEWELRSEDDTWVCAWCQAETTSPYGGGCDCTELCEMGPTCPGGMLAGLPGSGCHRHQASPGECLDCFGGEDVCAECPAR